MSLRFGMFLAPHHRVGMSPSVIPDFDGSLAPRVANFNWLMDTADEFKRQFVQAQDKAKHEYDNRNRPQQDASANGLSAPRVGGAR